MALAKALDAAMGLQNNGVEKKGTKMEPVPWRRGSAVTRANCSYGGAEFSSQQPQVSEWLSPACELAPRDAVPSLGLLGHCTQVHKPIFSLTGKCQG